MSSISILRRVPLALTIIGLVLSGGCRVLDVDMTSTPDAVRRGDPVTFDIKITNRSQCPLKPVVGAFLVAFIPLSEFTDLFGELPPDAPPEVLEFAEKVRMFFDELCSGGDPVFPDFPEVMALTTSCNRSGSEIVCQMSGPIPARQGNDSGMTFATMGDRLQCAVDGALMSCRLRIPLPPGASTAGGTTAAAVQQMTCFTGADFGVPDELSDAENFAVCFVGNPLTTLVGLAPGEMATGQVTLAARGAGGA